MAARVWVDYAAGSAGEWAITRVAAVRGAGLAAAPRLATRVRALDAPAAAPAGEVWCLGGVASHRRYTHEVEDLALVAASPPLDRPACRHACLIPMSKSEAWWDLAQDRRRAVFEETSQHIAVGLRYLPAIARRLVHGREVGGAFDFLTWFEFAPADEPAFDALLAGMRATPEWDYVSREVEIRLTRA